MTRNEERIQQVDKAWNALTDDLLAAVSSAALIRNKVLNALRDRSELDDQQIKRLREIEHTTGIVERMTKTLVEVHRDV